MLGTTFAATCSIESARGLAGRDAAAGTVATELLAARCGYRSGAATAPIPADTTAIASAAAKSATSRERLCGWGSAEAMLSDPGGMNMTPRIALVGVWCR